MPFDGPPAEVEKERKTSKAEETLPAKKKAEERLTKNTLLQAEADVTAERR